jgi:hypothetical protein
MHILDLQRDVIYPWLDEEYKVRRYEYKPQLLINNREPHSMAARLQL